VLALPVIGPWNGNARVAKGFHGPQSLLRYHYRFNTQDERGWSGENPLFQGDQSPYIHAAWGLAVDKSQ
jgi:hypothetical protein